MSEKTKRIIGVAIIAANAILALIGFFVLPDTLVVQMSGSGQPTTTMPKLLGLLLPLGISAFFGVLFIKDGNVKSGIGAGVGLLAIILTFIFNI